MNHQQMKSELAKTGLLVIDKNTNQGRATLTKEAAFAADPQVKPASVNLQDSTAAHQGAAEEPGEDWDSVAAKRKRRKEGRNRARQRKVPRKHPRNPNPLQNQWTSTTAKSPQYRERGKSS
jgi:hypothetical protein